MATRGDHLAYKLYLQQVARSVRPSASEVVSSEGVVGGTAEFELYLPTGWHGGVLAMQLAVDGSRIGTEVYFFDAYLTLEYYGHGAPAQRALDRLVDARERFRQLAAAGAKVRSWKAMKRQLVSSDEAQAAQQQHRAPCSDCPFARRALPGWLGTLSAEEWLRLAHGEGTSECHTLLGAQCAGLAIYRANISKLPRDPAALALGADRVMCFSSAADFIFHHQPRGRPIEALAGSERTTAGSPAPSRRTPRPR